MKILKKIFIVLYVFIYNNCAIAGPPPEYEFNNLNDGFKLSKDYNKPVFLLFGFNKCPACNMLYSRAFKDNKLKEYLKNNFILVYVSTLGENEPELYHLPSGIVTNKELIKLYKIDSVPAWLWLTPAAQILDSDKGGDTVPREFYLHGDKALKKFNNQ